MAAPNNKRNDPTQPLLAGPRSVNDGKVHSNQGLDPYISVVRVESQGTGPGAVERCITVGNTEVIGGGGQEVFFSRDNVFENVFPTTVTRTTSTVFLVAWDKNLLTDDGLIGYLKLEPDRVQHESSVMAQDDCRLWLTYRGLRAGSVNFSIVTKDATRPQQLQLTVHSAAGLRNPNIVKYRDAGDINIHTARSNLSKAAMALLVYFAVGIIYYSQVDGALRPVGENASVLDALYFCVVTITTVGYGDLHPYTWWTQLFTCFFLLFAIGVASLGMGLFVDAAMSHQTLRQKSDLREALEEDGAGGGQMLCRALNLGDRWQPPEENWHRCRARCCGCCSWWTDDLPAHQTCLRSFLLFAFIVATGSVIFWLDQMFGTASTDKNQNTVMAAIYYTVVTSTTIGYGDLYPTTVGGKISCCVYLLVSTVSLVKLLGDLAAIPLEQQRKRQTAQVLKQYGNVLLKDELQQLCKASGSGDNCTRDEYVLAMLVKTGQISQDDIDAAGKTFHLLDVNSDGVLDISDLPKDKVEL